MWELFKLSQTKPIPLSSSLPFATEAQPVTAITLSPLVLPKAGHSTCMGTGQRLTRLASHVITRPIQGTLLL